MADTTRPLLQTAVIYDFDGTLARGNMQEVSFIPSIGEASVSRSKTASGT